MALTGSDSLAERLRFHFEIRLATYMLTSSAAWTTVHECDLTGLLPYRSFLPLKCSSS
jgi:hypothetical protein